MENQNITWRALEFKAHKKSVLWYICFTLIAVALIGYGVYSRNALTVITFVLIASGALFFSLQTPREINFELSPSSVRVGESNYPYRNLKKFWIIYTAENKTLNFETTAYLNSQISLQLGRQDPLQVKQFLKNYLKEDLDKEESFTDIISRKIKF